MKSIKTEKYCNKCKQVLPIENFAKSSKDGFQSYCKECKATYQRENRDKKLVSQRKYRSNNRDILVKKQREYHNSHREQELEYRRIWTKTNRHKLRAKDAKRRAKKLQATPKWSDLKAIQEIYKNCPEGYQVDHIIPLQGKNVSGLHIPQNLQYLTKHDNLSKGNRI